MTTFNQFSNIFRSVKVRHDVMLCDVNNYGIPQARQTPNCQMEKGALLPNRQPNKRRQVLWQGCSFDQFRSHICRATPSPPPTQPESSRWSCNYTGKKRVCRYKALPNCAVKYFFSSLYYFYFFLLQATSWGLSQRGRTRVNISYKSEQDGLRSFGHDVCQFQTKLCNCSELKCKHMQDKALSTTSFSIDNSLLGHIKVGSLPTMAFQHLSRQKKLNNSPIQLLLLK